MKRIAGIALCVSLACAPVLSSDLVNIRHDDAAGYVLYLDKSSVVKEGPNTRARFLLDFKSVRTTDDELKRPYRSIADYNYINCEDETIASAGQDIYEKAMGSGKIVNSFRVKEQDVFFSGLAGDNGEAKYQSICKK
jgi:hypothetical protein